jgi:hypothetical protein|nr:MAG TPA: hypothetical protein [Caudoviricetes sp.]
MDKKEITKMVATAMDNGSLFGASVTLLAVGTLSLLTGAFLFGGTLRRTRRFNEDFPTWDDGWDELHDK